MVKDDSCLRLEVRCAKDSQIARQMMLEENSEVIHCSEEEIEIIIDHIDQFVYLYLQLLYN